MFWLVSMVREVATRTERVTAPKRHRLKQMVCGGSIRLVRSRPQRITEEQLKAHYHELYHLQRQGILQVREGTVTGPVHKFDPEWIKYHEELQASRKDHHIAKAALMSEGKTEEAMSLQPTAPTAPAWGKPDTLPLPDEHVLPTFQPEPVEPEIEVTVEEPQPAPEEPVEEVPEPAATSDDKPDFTKMSKTDVIEWLCKTLNVKPTLYSGHSKKQLIKIAEEL